MRNSGRDWKIYGYKLNSLEQELDAISYSSIFAVRSITYNSGFHAIPNDSLSVDQTHALLSEPWLEPPHGLDLLKVNPPTNLPKIPPLPAGPDQLHDIKYWSERATKVEKRISELRTRFDRQYVKDCSRAEHLRAGYAQNNPKAVELLAVLSLRRHPFPAPLIRPVNVRYDAAARIILCVIEVPDFRHLPILKRRGDSFSAKWRAAPLRERKKALEAILYSVCIRTAYLVAKSDAADRFDIVAVNVKQRWFDSATGAPREGVVASLQAPKSEAASIQPAQIDCKACFRHFRGIITSIERAAAIHLDVDKTRRRPTAARVKPGH